MRLKDIQIGKCYRLKSSPDYGYVRVIEIIKPYTWQMKALAKDHGIPPKRAIVVKCEHLSSMDSVFSLVRYFKASDLRKDGK